ncbi:MAG: MFS transporter, partial [Mycolicibacter sinensis]
MSARRRDLPDPGRRRRPGSGPGNGSAAEHPGMANYPSDQRQRPPMPSANRYLPPLRDHSEAPRRH